MSTDPTPDDRTRPPIADLPELLTPEWVTAALRHAGHDVTVTSLDRDTGRHRSDGHEHPPGARPSTVTRGSCRPRWSRSCPPATRSSRAMVAGIYRTEVEFYRQLAPTVSVRTPHCYYSDLGRDLDRVRAAARGPRPPGAGRPDPRVHRRRGPRRCGQPGRPARAPLVRPDPDRPRVDAADRRGRRHHDRTGHRATPPTGSSSGTATASATRTRTCWTGSPSCCRSGSWPARSAWLRSTVTTAWTTCSSARATTRSPRSTGRRSRSASRHATWPTS